MCSCQSNFKDSIMSFLVDAEHEREADTAVVGVCK